MFRVTMIGLALIMGACYAYDLHCRYLERRTIRKKLVCPHADVPQEQPPTILMSDGEFADFCRCEYRHKVEFSIDEIRAVLRLRHAYEVQR